MERDSIRHRRTKDSGSGSQMNEMEEEDLKKIEQKEKTGETGQGEVVDENDFEK